MIIDDEWQTREGLVQWVPWDRLGIDRVQCMENALQALDAMKEDMPDMIISDVRMPHMTGVELLIRLRNEGNMVPFLFISGYADKEYLMAAIRYQASDYVEKPIDMQELTQALEKTVSQLKAARNTDAEVTAIRLTSADTRYDEVDSFLQATGHSFSQAENYWVCMVRSRQQAEDAVRTWGWPHMAERLDEENLLFVTCQMSGDAPPDFASLYEALLIQDGMAILGISCPCTRPQELSKRRAQATLAIQRGWFFDQGGCFCYAPPDGYARSVLDKLMERIRPGLSAQTSQTVTAHLLTLQEQWRSIPGLYPLEAVSLLSSLREQILQWLPAHQEQIKGDEVMAEVWKEVAEAGRFREALLAVNRWVDLLFQRHLNRHRYGVAMTKALEYVDNHYAENLSVELLAKECFISSSHLSHLFRSSLNTSVKQYINDLRIERAKALLLDSKVRLYEVGSRVGIADASYFSKLFRKATGATPSEYRAKYLK